MILILNHETLEWEYIKEDKNLPHSQLLTLLNLAINERLSLFLVKENMRVSQYLPSEKKWAELESPSPSSDLYLFYDRSDSKFICTTELDEWTLRHNFGDILKISSHPPLVYKGYVRGDAGEIVPLWFTVHSYQEQGVEVCS